MIFVTCKVAKVELDSTSASVGANFQEKWHSVFRP